GSPAAMLLRLKDITPNPFGNFSVQFNDGSAEMGVAENAPGPYAICIKRESGKSGAVQVDYLISGNAVKGADFNFVGSNIPTASTGSITFANNGNDQECFSVQVNNDATIGTADKKVTVAITGLTPEADKHPILTAQDSATLTIQDYSAGKFGFEAASYSCKEPNDDNSIPVELRASTAEKTCAITVIRTDIGATAPAAKLNVAAVYRDGFAADFSFPATLEWPAITAKNPASLETEIQTIKFTIANDNKQEDDKLVDISLTPFGGEVIETDKDTAELTIIDVTSPALVRVVADTDKNSYQQGELVTFSIKRENNSNTAFSVDYNLSFTDMPSGKTAADFINFSSADTKTTCSSSTQCQGTITFTANGANEVVKKIRIASSIPNPGMTMSFELSNPSVPRVVGIGSLSNVNTDNLQNRMSRAVAVGAVNSKLADIYSINFDGKIFTPEQSVAIPAYTSISTAFEPVRNAVNVNFTLPAGVQSAAENVNYRWEFTNNWDDGMAVPPSLEMTNASGTVAYNNGNNALNVSSSLTIPFVVKETSFVLKLTLAGGGETFSKELTFNVKPLWRQLEHNEGGKCMAPNGRGSCGYDSTTWTWNPSNKMLFNLEAVKNQSDNKCLMWSGSSTDAKLAACNSGVADSQVTFTNGNNFRVDNKRVCRYLNWFTYQYRRNDCNTGDNKWKWRN
ncbi:MAG: Calx-beta domain-containing protein, partial [Venatoribacter sp.]